MRTSLRLLACLSIAAVACGSSEADIGDTNPSTSPGTRGFDDGKRNEGGDVTPASACVTSSSDAENAPAYLVFAFDRSDSMGKDSKWTSCAKGLKTFFADPSTTGLSASLQFFPQYAGSDVSCNVADYSSPAVAMESLPDTGKLAGAIDATKLASGTPTLPAIEGASVYAAQVSAAHPGMRVALVLVTDGLPTGCNSTVETVTAAAKKAAATIPVYVVGIRSPDKEAEGLSNLDAIAAAGGTSKAIMVDAASPTQLVSDFEKALGQVKAAAGACELAIPAAPPGETLDPQKVNISVDANGQASTLTYDASCAGGAGWHYDDPQKPTKIILCQTACDGTKNGAKVSILLGCAMKGTVK